MEKENKSSNNNSEPEDDRVIANMNIDGMPWHVQSKPLYPESKEELTPLSRKETLRLTFNAMLAALVVGLIFIGVFFLFGLFCIYVWF